MFADLLLHCCDTLTEVSVTTDFWWTSQIGEVASSWLDQAGSQGAPRRAGLGPVLGVGEDGHLGCSCPLASPWTWDVPADTASLLTPRWGGVTVAGGRGHSLASRGQGHSCLAQFC